MFIAVKTIDSRHSPAVYDWIVAYVLNYITVTLKTADNNNLFIIFPYNTTCNVWF